MNEGKACWIPLLLLIVAAPVRADLVSTERLVVNADFRLRLESDFDSRDATGVPREDRSRMRARARLNVRFEPDERVRLEVRLRSGQRESQQSPHVTLLDFDGNDTGSVDFDLDRWSLRGRAGGLWASAGRDLLPIWKQNEHLSDDDATFAGIALGASGIDFGPGELSWCGGYFSSPVGMREFSGNLALAQLHYAPTPGKVGWNLALSAFRFDADPDDPDAAALLQNNGLRDYSILQLSLQARWKLRGRRLSLGVDGMHNLESYGGNPDPTTAANSDQTDGLVLSASYGGLDAGNAWLVGYTFARVELFAVHNSYSLDYWVRWGSGTQTRASDMRGHELRFGWAFNEKANLVARLFLVDAITSVEDGNRLRIDYNHAF